MSQQNRVNLNTLADTNVNDNTSGDVTAAGATDNFNRADNTSSLGTATTGQVWAVTASSTWGISGNTAKPSAGLTTDNIAYLESGLSNLSVSCDMLDIVSFANKINGVVVRYSDASNYIICLSSWTPGFPTADFYLYKIVAGVQTQLGSTYNQSFPNYLKNIKITTSGSNISVFLNGNTTTIITATDSFNSSATKVGIFYRDVNTDSKTVTFDNFIAQ